ncbi:fumarylacetoacetase [Pseudonocardia asaccharolytica]|uniref:fumarylacetoacetase n=1 Tax=Pseudonocardia asaccharolytica DSM 44247 = NBRC 16224 TaxID=1123024 RepID=A0A511D3I2_9PSEU|nr:fumarylacetoacetase [Pseudonocardia asaccharolytica]GEL18154.1 fumarylacetoacetase [Pseudonocardia asaccharolytica DSM 44247 = NBRC 16224]
MTWLDLPEDTGFGLENLPYGVFSPAEGRPRIGVAIGAAVLDAGAVATATGAPFAQLLAGPVLNPLLAAGRPTWQQVRRALVEWLTEPVFADVVRPHLHPRAEVTLQLPVEIGDYVDFYASEHHATNVGRIFRPDSDALTPNWKHLPIGYHGRAGSVVVSGTPIVRPTGQRKGPADPEPVFGPSVRLDIEAEVGFVVGAGSALGTSIPVADFAEHVFGVFLLNDWSARDIQAWEYVPLGPFLGKSFATSVSPWIVPLEALRSARVAPPARDPQPLPYLRGAEDWGLDLAIEVRLNGHRLARPPFAAMYWTPAQMLAHLTVNGAPTRPGDVYASGTVSGPERDQRGSLLELSWGGTEPLTLADGSTRTYLEDGDEVTISASAPAPGGSRIEFGEVSGRIVPAPDRT